VEREDDEGPAGKARGVDRPREGERRGADQREPARKAGDRGRAHLPTPRGGRNGGSRSRPRTAPGRAAYHFRRAVNGLLSRARGVPV
jgi:hypothetical protein